MRARRRRRRACITSALLLDLLDDLFSANARRWARCRFDAGPASQKVGRHWPALARCLAFDGLPLFLSYYITTVAQLLANPGRHRALVWHLYGVVPTSSTLVQKCTDVGWCSVFAGMQVHIRPVPWRVYTGIFYDKGTLSLAFCWFRARPKTGNFGPALNRWRTREVGRLPETGSLLCHPTQMIQHWLRQWSFYLFYLFIEYDSLL